jgi:hypothetical protein
MGTLGERVALILHDTSVRTGMDAVLPVVVPTVRGNLLVLMEYLQSIQQ